MENNSLREIWDKILSYKKVIMTLHSGPDGDSLGACTAMKYILERKGIYAKIVSFDDLPENNKDFSFISEIEFQKDISEVNLGEFDCFIALDCSDISYMSGKLLKDFKLPKIFTINIDHHKTNIYYGDLNYVSAKKASTCSVLMDLFKANNVKFDKELSLRLLIGVSTDSGFFTFETATLALSDADFLIKNGADYQEVLKKIIYNEPLKMKKYIALLIENLEIDSRGFGYSCVSYKEIIRLGLNKAEIRLGINDLQLISELKFVFTLTEIEDHIKGSFRSKKGVDVSLFAQDLGGGGHREASAFMFENISMENALKKVLAVVEKHLKNINLDMLE